MKKINKFATTTKKEENGMFYMTLNKIGDKINEVLKANQVRKQRSSEKMDATLRGNSVEDLNS